MLLVSIKKNIYKSESFFIKKKKYGVFVIFFLKKELFEKKIKYYV